MSLSATFSFQTTMENDAYTDVLSHYDDDESTSDRSGDSWTAGEPKTGFESLSLEEPSHEKVSDAINLEEDTSVEEAPALKEEVEDYPIEEKHDDISELVPEGSDSDEESDGIAPQEESVTSEPITEDTGFDSPQLTHPDVSITRDPSISSRITSDTDIFSTRTPSAKQGIEFDGFLPPNVKSSTRSSTMTSNFTSMFQAPDNMNQFVNDAGYSESVYSNDDVISEFSYMPNDDKPWELGYQSPADIVAEHGSLSKVPTNNTFLTSSGNSIARFESQLDRNREGFGNDYDSVMDNESITTVDNATENDDSSIVDNATLKSDTTTTNDGVHDGSFNTTNNSADTTRKSIPISTSAVSGDFKELRSLLTIVDANFSDSQKIQNLRDLRIEQRNYDTSLSNWLSTQMEMAKNTVPSTQREFGSNVKVALETDYTGGASTNSNNIGLGYGLSAGLDSTKSRVADVGEGLQRGMLSLSKVARGIVRRRDK